MKKSIRLYVSQRSITMYLFSPSRDHCFLLEKISFESLAQSVQSKEETIGVVYMIPGCLSYQHESITDTSKNIIPERVNPYCVAWSRFSFEYENLHPDQRPLVSVWNQSPGRVEWVAHALFSPSKLRWRRVSHFGRWMQRKTNFM